MPHDRVLLSRGGGVVSFVGVDSVAAGEGYVLEGGGGGGGGERGEEE